MITLVEECRIRWLHKEKAERITGGGMLVARQSIDYILPVMYGPELTMTLTVSTIGNSSFTVTTRGDQDGRQVFSSDVVLVHLDRETGRPAPIAEDIRSLLERYLAV